MIRANCRKYKVKVEQIIDAEIFDDGYPQQSKSDDEKLIREYIKENVPHTCIGSFHKKIESRGRVKIIDIKRRRK